MKIYANARISKESIFARMNKQDLWTLALIDGNGYWIKVLSFYGPKNDRWIRYNRISLGDLEFSLKFDEISKKYTADMYVEFDRHLSDYDISIDNITIFRPVELVSTYELFEIDCVDIPEEDDEED